jgi:hypothetical protein
MGHEKELRAFGWYRVSSPEQRDYGSSLESQRMAIEAAAARHGVCIVGWFGGQEHATPQFEHREFRRMIETAIAKGIPAIFAPAGDRLTRDTESGEWAQRELRKHGIQLFIGGARQDLNSGTVRVALTLQTKVAEVSTSERLDQSVRVRIERAALGFITSSLPPYGRGIRVTLRGTRPCWETNPDGTAKWRFDPKAKSYVERATALYLAGKTWGEVAAALGDDENTVRRRVLAAGGAWQQRFRLREGQRPEDFATIPFAERLSFERGYVTVTIPIPALMDEVTIARVAARAAEHRVDYRARNKQVLGGFMKCVKCEASIGTHFHRLTRAVYLQHNGPRRDECPANFGRYEPLERSFVRRAGALLREPGLLEAAAREALLAQTTQRPELEQQLTEARSRQQALNKDHNAHYDQMKALREEGLSEGGKTILKYAADAKRLDGQLAAAEQEVTRLEAELKVTRLPPDFSARLEFTLFCLHGFVANSRWLMTWPKSQLRVLCKFLFGEISRKPVEGKLRRTDHRSGIYLDRARDEATGEPLITWAAHGWFPQVSDKVWLNPKVTTAFNAAVQGRIDKKRLVELISRLDFAEFRFAEQTFNARKLEGTHARSSRQRLRPMPPQ